MGCCKIAARNPPSRQTKTMVRKRWTRSVIESLFRLDVSRLDDRQPLRGFGLVPGAKRFRRELVALGDFEPEIKEPAFHRRISERLDHGSVEFVHGLFRR